MVLSFYPLLFGGLPSMVWMKQCGDLFGLKRCPCSERQQIEGTPQFFTDGTDGHESTFCVKPFDDDVTRRGGIKMQFR